MNFRLIIYIFLSVFIISCNGGLVKTNDPNHIANCLNDNTNHILIRWGNYLTKKDKLIDGYMIKSNGIIYRLNKIEDTTGIEITGINDSLYCLFKNNVEMTIMKNQILNVFADTSRFVFLENPKNQYVFRAFWNPNYFDKNRRNIEFGALYTQYMLLLPENEILKGR